MIRWGIMATGTIARKFAETINKMNGEAVLVAVASRNTENAKAFAKEYNIPKYYDTYEDLCRDTEVDAIYISTPNNMHFENSLMCLNHGKNVLCEKPFTTNKNDAVTLYNTAKEKKLFIMEGFWIKHTPLLKKMEEMIAEDVIGDIRCLRADYGFTISDENRKRRKFNSELGGGALLDIGVYNIGFAKMVMKDSPIKINSNEVINEYGTDEFSTIMLEYPNKKTAVLTTSIGMKIAKEGAIYGSKGSIFLPDFQNAEKMQINIYDKEPYTIEMPFEINGFEYQIREVDRCIELGMNTSDVLTMNDSLDVLEIMDSVRSLWNMRFSFEK